MILFDEYDGAKEYVIYGDHGIAHKVIKDVDFDRNKELFNTHDGYTPSRDLRYIAEIDNVIHLLWIQRYGTDPLQKGNEQLLKRILNDPEWRFIRTSEGRV